MNEILEFFKEFFLLLVNFLTNMKSGGLLELLGLDDVIGTLLDKIG